MKKLFCLLLIGFFTAGCAKNSVELPKTNYYSECCEPLEYVKNRSGKGSAIAQGAVTGGALSGFLSIMIGALAGSLNGRNLLVGIAAGSAMGGALGSSGDSREDNRKMAEYLEKIDGDISEIQTVQQAAGAVALQCYSKNYHELLAEMRRGSITRAAAQEHFEEILAGSEAADHLLEKPFAKETMQKEFEAALAKAQ